MLSLKKGDKIFLVGIGGAGMTALAYFLRKAGFEIAGSDILKSQNVEKLIKDGFTVYPQHSSDNVLGSKLVIYTSAVKKDNKEIVAAKKLGIKAINRAVAIKLISREFNCMIAVSGTHGKTTAATMIYHIFNQSGFAPSTLIGGDFDGYSGGIYRKKGYLITEACEYAKTFLKLRPHIGVILNIDNDHLEVYKTRKRLERAFKRFSRKSQKKIIYSGCKGVNFKNAVTFGLRATDKYRAKRLKENKGYYSFDLYISGVFSKRINLKIPGKHNVLNALSAIAVAAEQGLDIKDIKSAVESFTGVKRRFEKIYQGKKITLYDDYAHHPAEIETVIDIARSEGYNNLTLIFQPFTFSRTKLLFSDFVHVLKKADKVIICPIMGGREKNKYGVCSEQLVNNLKNAVFAEDFDCAADIALKESGENECIVTVGCGNVYEAGKKIVAKESFSE